MKRIGLLMAALLLRGCGQVACAQNAQPQNSFSAQVLQANPSLYLTFNNPAQLFRENTTGVSFLPWDAVIGANPTPTVALTAGYVDAEAVPFARAGVLNTVSLQYYAACPAAALTLVVLNQSGTSLTIAQSFTVNVVSSTALQTFRNGTDFSGISVTAGQLLGYWAPTGGCLPGKDSTSTGTGRYYFAASSALPTGAQTYTANSNLISLSSTVTPSSTASEAILSGQTGFDSTEPNNTAAAFPYNTYIYAPNDTLGDVEWNVPFALMFQIDRLNWGRSGTKVLVSKGNIGSGYAGRFWDLTISMKNAVQSQFCFNLSAYNGSASATHSSVCSPAIVDFPNGYNYQVLVTNDGTGALTGFHLYVNGQTGTQATVGPGGSNPGFGGATVAIGGSGTGYAATTAFTSSGGGTNCHVSGTMNATSGVPSSITITATTDYGCTSVPTLTLTSPTGTGATLTATLVGATLSTATTAPLYVSGYWSGTAGTAWNPAASFGSSTNASEAALLIDEFAAFPSNAASIVQPLFYQTKFYQGLLKPIPKKPYVLIFDNDGCDDTDNLYALAVTIGAQRLGYITLAGIVDSDGSGQSMAMYRQMLDQAGLAHIPMSVPSVRATSSSICTAANINTYNSATPQAASGYPAAVTMYRTILAANPTAPVFIMLGGSFRGMSDLMQSAADGISSLTGAQLLAQNATNGGAIYAQGLGANISFSSDNSLEDWTAGQYVLSHNGSLPIYFYGGQPQSSGPGVLTTRNSKDPLYLVATSQGSDGRQAYDSLPTASFVSNAFAGGVSIAIGGSGTGYAAITYFTSTGGGPNCVVTGYMNSTSGVPVSLAYGSGGTSYTGFGYGCTSAPTIVLTAPTGTGVTLTATPTMTCGTVTITSATAGTTSSTPCSNHYFLPYSVNADGGGTLFLQWFLNSLIDPPPNGAPRVQ